MNSYRARLATFDSWPADAAVQPRVVAAAGLYYLSDEKMVVCAFCRGCIPFREVSDDPKALHDGLYPHCAATLGYPAPKLVVPKREIIEFARLGIKGHKGPKHRDYSHVDERVKSYYKWPYTDLVPLDMAQAGLFFDFKARGAKKRIRCFHCSEGFPELGTGSNYWQAHALRTRHCYFLTFVKGEKYVDQVRDGLVEEMPSKKPEEMPSKKPEERPKKIRAPGPRKKRIGRRGRKRVANAREIVRLSKQLTALRASTFCRLCYAAKMDVTFLPCTHLVACSLCSSALTDCPICRTPIAVAVRIHRNLKYD